MSEFNITRMRPVRSSVREGGSRVLAYFDCEVRGIRINSCQVLQRENGDVAVTPPLIKCGNDRFRAVKFPESSMMVDFFDAAMGEYRAAKAALPADTGRVVRQTESREPDDAGLRRMIGETMDLAGLG